MWIQFCSDNNNNSKVTLAALYTCTEYSVFTMIIIMITKEFYYIPNSIHIYLIINYTYIDNKIRLIRWEIGREPWGALLPRRVSSPAWDLGILGGNFGKPCYQGEFARREFWAQESAHGRVYLFWETLRTQGSAHGRVYQFEGHWEPKGLPTGQLRHWEPTGELLILGKLKPLGTLGALGNWTLYLIPKP